jgi:hypothetical protein
LYCEKAKICVKDGRLIVKETKSIGEASMFSRNPNGSYSAQTGNDDIMMTVVTGSSFFDTVDFSEIVEEYFDNIDSSIQNMIENIVDDSGDDSNEYDFF